MKWNFKRFRIKLMKILARLKVALIALKLLWLKKNKTEYKK